MPVVFIVLWALVFFYFIKLDKEKIFNPIVWLFAGWSFSFGLYCFSGINYHYVLSVKVGFYYWGFAVMVALGFFTSKKIKIIVGKERNVRVRPKMEYITKSTYKLYIAVVAFGALMVVFDIIRLNGISSDLHIRLNISIIGNLGILCSGLGLVLWLYECIRAIVNNQKIGMSAYLSVFCYILPALITSGRQSILIIGVASIVILIYSLGRIKKYKYWASLVAPILIVGVLLIVYVTVISSSRTVVSNKISLFNFMYSSTMSEKTTVLLEKLGFLGFLKTILMEIIYYYSHELSMLEIMFRYYDGPMFWGMVQMSIVARNIPIGDIGSISDLMWKYLDSMSDAAGVYNHVWRSAAGSAYLDFGIVGALIFAFIVGYFLGKYFKKCKNEQNNYNMVGMGLMCAGMLFCMQFSPISEAYWLYPVLWWVFLPFIEKFLIKKSI